MVMGKCNNKHYLALYNFIKWSMVSCIVWVCLKYGVLNSTDWASKLILYVDLFFNILFMIIMLVLIGLLLLRSFKGLNKKRIRVLPSTTQQSNNIKNNIALVFYFFLILGLYFTIMSSLPWFFNFIQSDNNVNAEILDSEYSNKVSITFQTYNEGFIPARNVKVKISVLEYSDNYRENHNKLVTGDVLVSKIFYVGTIYPGKSVTNTVSLNMPSYPKKIVYNIHVV